MFIQYDKCHIDYEAFRDITNQIFRPNQLIPQHIVHQQGCYVNKLASA